MVADYSQIELRLLAHMSGDPVLIDAFRQGEDIHTRTAAEVMGVPPMLVTREARNNAKAVNFGIVYGISAFGLAANLGISRKEAEAYIKAYFERYCRREAVHRRDHREDARNRHRAHAVRPRAAHSRHQQPQSQRPRLRRAHRRQFADSGHRGRSDQAGDGAHRPGARRDRESKLLLQVHDELVLEAPPGEIDRVKELVKREMEGASELEVPLLVEVGVGENWRDAK